MSKILFEINYNVYPGKREEYLKIIQELKTLIRNDFIKDYYVYENANHPNSFSELFVCNTEEEYENFEDNQSDEIKAMITKLLTEFVLQSKISYTTKKEL
jgi:hypothetical protein